MHQTSRGWRAPRAIFLSLTLALTVLLAVAACANEDEATPTPGEVVPATATPTMTATPNPTATPPPTGIPAATDAVDPTPTGTSDEGETQALIPADLKTYTDDLYGFSLQIPETWTGERPTTGLLSVAGSFDTGDEDIIAQAFAIFTAEEAHPAEIAQQQIMPLAGLAAFRTITEADITLDDGSEAHQIFYSYGVGSDEERGSLVFIARGTMAFGLHIQAPRITYERNFDVLDTISTSIRAIDSNPYGTPRDDTLVLYLDQGPLTLDPAVATDAGSAQYIRQIFSGLVRLNADLIPEPDLATWEVSEDGTVYTFTIKDGARFHDGTPVTAQDVIFSWERALNRNLTAVGSSGASYLDDIVGAKEYAAGEADSITGLEATDDSTLVVTIDAAKSYFVSKLSHTATYVVLQSNAPEVPDPRLREEGDEDDAETSEETEEQEAPDPWYYTAIGTGPYQLTVYERSRAAHLTAFEGYLGPAHSVGNLVFRFHAGLSTKMVEEGFVDATTWLGSGDYDALVAEEDPLVDQITQTDALSIQYLAFNTTAEPFNDPDVRRAFLWAVDREAIFEEFGASGLTIAHGFMPPGLPGYNEDIAEIRYDPAAAKALLDTTAFGRLGDDQPTIFVAGGGDAGEIYHAIFTQWQDNLAVRIQYRALGRAYFYQLPAVVEAGYNIYSYGWLADYPDPHNFLDVLFHTQSANNDGKAGSEEIDELLEQARVAGEGRLEQYREIERRMVDEAIAFPLYFGTDLILVGEHVRNLSLDAQGYLRLENVELEFGA